MYTPNPLPAIENQEDLIRYLVDELYRISFELKTLRPEAVAFRAQYVDPAKPVEGDTVFFKPAGAQIKDGLYTYNTGAWQKNS